MCQSANLESRFFFPHSQIFLRVPHADCVCATSCALSSHQLQAAQSDIYYY